MNPEESKYFWFYRWHRDGSVDKVAIWDIPENKRLFRQEEKMNALRIFRKYKIKRILETRD